MAPEVDEGVEGGFGCSPACWTVFQVVYYYYCYDCYIIIVILEVIVIVFFVSV